MSYIDKKAAQTSRMYYKLKDHRDCYAEGKFHGGMWLPGCDSSVDDLIWRKKFPDKYFRFVCNGTYEFTSLGGICYPEIQATSDAVPGFGTLIYTENYELSMSNYWWSNLNISSDDSRLWKQTKVSGPFSRVGHMYGMKNGFIVQDYDNYKNWYYFPIVDNGKGYGELGEYVPISMPPARNDSWYVVTNRDADYALIQCDDPNTSARKHYIFDEESKSFNSFSASGIQVYSTMCFANGRYFNCPSPSTYYEIYKNGNVVSHSSPFNDTPSSIIYRNGTYYLYRGNTIKTTTNLSSFSTITLPNKITVKAINEYTSPYEIETSRIADAMKNYGGMYVNSKRIKDNSNTDISVSVYYSNPWSNNITLYMDNLLIQESDNNFCFTSSNFTQSNPNVRTPQKIWQKYYDLI